MKKLLTAALAASALLASSCISQKEEEGPLTAVLEGTVCDFNLDGMLLNVGQGDTLVVATPDVDSLPGVFIGDNIAVGCLLAVENGDTCYVAQTIRFIKADFQHLIDTWTTPQMGIIGGQGFTLYDDNTACSVNIAGVDITNWGVVSNDTLVLVMKPRKGYGQIQSPVTYHIDKLTADSLVLVNVATGDTDWILTNQQ